MDIFNFFFQEAPKVTKFLTLSTIAISLLSWFEIISPIGLYLNFNLIVKKFQIWRLFTNFMYFGEFSLSFFFHAIIYFRNSKLLEKNVFKGNVADYIFFLVFCMMILLFLSYFTGSLFLAQSLSFAMTYYWGRKSKLTQVELMGIFNIRAPYLPMVYLTISFLLDNNFVTDLLGLIAGHLFFYFRDILPRIKKFGNKSLLKTPDFIVKICDKLNINNDYLLEGEEGDFLF